ncbi:tomatinase [Colletotrichum truncatum]|uniref:Tomatinase n=1 Tax=Colletotrichum truncatum TaxID=5467 RepID=A0ACC3YE57_COLTU|nr:tomatinase [Colletotrichum truncatum]KAF6790221.1 tomatinase [Colletotrichum truncatum]
MKATTLFIALLTVTEAADIVPSTGTTALREEAQKKNVLIGSGAINPTYLDDPRFAFVLAEQFNSLSPENKLKWNFINPTPGQYDWDKIDRLVDFAEENNMKVKGHGFISGCCNPDYLLNITDATEVRTAMKTHFEAVMHRYDGKMDRWDVVSEALETQGGGLQVNNFFYKTLGPGYIADAFRIAREAGPDAKLYLNENMVESNSGKRQELYDLVSGLVRDGVPIDGIALQMHVTLEPLVPGVITEMVDFFKGLELEVTIAELDVHTYNATQQTEIYGAVIEEALASGITDISFWGFTDKHLYTWLPGAKPLMFDEDYSAKGAFYATHTALTNFVNAP